MVFQTSGKGNTRQIFGTIFNAKAVQSLMNVDVSFDFKAEKSVIKVDEDGGKHISHP